MHTETATCADCGVWIDVRMGGGYNPEFVILLCSPLDILPKTLSVLLKSLQEESDIIFTADCILIS